MGSLFEFNQILIVVYLLLVLGLTLEGGTRKIGWLWAALISLILTPIIGFFFIILSAKSTSPNSSSSDDKVYTCTNCGYGYLERREECLICGKKFPVIMGNVENKDKLTKTISA